MRALKLQVQMTLDGFIAGPDGEMDWLTFTWGPDINAYVAALNESIDCILLGRHLATGFIPHWASNPEGEDPAGVAKMNKTPKVVFTRTLTRCDWPNTRLATGDLREEIAALKAAPGKDLMVYGGGTLVASLLTEGLIDELNLFVNPVAIGAGMAIFNTLQATQQLVLKQTTPFACGIVALKYHKAS